MNLENRKYIIIGIFVTIILIFLIRLFSLQVIQDKWKKKAANITERKITIYPSRGLIYDRNGKLLVANRPVYDLMVVPTKVSIKDTVKFCDLVGITKQEFKKKMKKATTPPNSPYKASIFEKQIKGDNYAKIAQHLFRYKGFYGQKRTLRSYKMGIAPHTLGYVSEVNATTVKNNSYYQAGDLIGASGLEKEYEKYLRGRKGVKYVVVDVFNNKKGPYMDGAYDTLAKPAKDLTTTLDAELQKYGEKLMKNKIGSIVAIEPSSGEILAMVSSPSYNPNKLVGRVRSKHYPKLSKDTLRPLFNRTLNSEYPPGSIFKIVQSLIGMNEGILTPKTEFYCDGSVIGDHVSPGYYNLFEAIRSSSNMYFYLAFKKMILRGKKDDVFKDARYGLKIWKNQVTSLGIGKKLDVDCGDTKAGFVPGPKYYNKIYGKGRWGFSTIYSLSIGQGELILTPLHMANFTSIIANRGSYYMPHVVKRIGDTIPIDKKYRKKRQTKFDSSYFNIPIKAMEAVVESPQGTARRAKSDSIKILGKTGTVQNPHGEDHSVFIAFAPKDEPKIALATYVENAGFGGT
ncbi:MAG: penicillin-binding transpeptidase domain-containing protein, partial [Flavobacteriales bacterium]